MHMLLHRRNASRFPSPRKMYQGTRQPLPSANRMLPPQLRGHLQSAATGAGLQAGTVIEEEGAAVLGNQPPVAPAVSVLGSQYLASACFSPSRRAPTNRGVHPFLPAAGEAGRV